MEGRGRRRGVDSFVLWSYPIWVQFNLPTTATLGTEESGPCKEVAVVERLKKEWMYGLSAKKKKMAVVDRWPLVEVRLYNVLTILSPIAGGADM